MNVTMDEDVVSDTYTLPPFPFVLEQSVNSQDVSARVEEDGMDA